MTLNFEQDTFEEVTETVVSSVFRARSLNPTQGWIAVKSAPIDSRLSKQPHDIGKELRILQDLSCQNESVVRVLYDDQSVLTLCHIDY